MARIIEQGYHRLTCRKCKTLFEYIQNEVREGTFNHDYLGDFDTEDYVSCPSCSDKFIIKYPL